MTVWFVNFRWRNWWIRGMFSLVMIAGFAVIVYFGPLALILLVSSWQAVKPLFHLTSIQRVNAGKLSLKNQGYGASGLNVYAYIVSKHMAQWSCRTRVLLLVIFIVFKTNQNQSWNRTSENNSFCQGYTVRNEELRNEIRMGKQALYHFFLLYSVFSVLDTCKRHVKENSYQSIRLLCFLFSCIIDPVYSNQVLPWNYFHRTQEVSKIQPALV